jgi:hypothetical protein
MGRNRKFDQRTSSDGNWSISPYVLPAMQRESVWKPEQIGAIPESASAHADALSRRYRDFWSWGEAELNAPPLRIAPPLPRKPATAKTIRLRPRRAPPPRNGGVSRKGSASNANAMISLGNFTLP